jgi:hypothetical protein
MNLLAVGEDDVAEMCKQTSEGEEKSNMREQQNGDGWVRSHLPEFPYTIFIVVICRALNDNDMI